MWVFLWDVGRTEFYILHFWCFTNTRLLRVKDPSLFCILIVSSTTMMQGNASSTSKVSMILCCLCGSSIEYNQSAMCIQCLRLQVDVTKDIKRDLDMLNCGKCGRWHIGENTWMHLEPESPQLLAHCLKRMQLDKHSARIIDSLWVWTEPHSKRLKVAVTVEKEHLNVKLQQRVVVEYVVKSKQCLTCIRENTDHTWGAMLQIRQRTGGDKASMYQLEAMLSKTGLHNLMLNVEVRHEGLDLTFATKNQAEKVLEAVMQAVPARKSATAKVVSEDKRTNKAHMEFTAMVEIVPIQKHDLIVLPRSFTGGKPALMLCHKLSSNLHLVSPQTLLSVEVSATKFYSTPFTPISRSRDLVEFLVLDITPVGGAHYGAGAANSHQAVASGEVFGAKKASTSRKGGGGGGGGGGPMMASGACAGAAGSSASSISITTLNKRSFCLAEAQIARAADLGRNGDDDGGMGIMTVMTHLGHILSAGDTVMGYYIAAANIVDNNVKLMDGLAIAIPDAVLVRKVYPLDESKGVRSRRNRRRRIAPWMNNAKSAAAAAAAAGGSAGEDDDDDDDYDDDDDEEEKEEEEEEGEQNSDGKEIDAGDEEEAAIQAQSQTESVAEHE